MLKRDTDTVAVAEKDEMEAEPAGDNVGTPGEPLTATTDTVARPVLAEEGEIALDADKIGVAEKVARLVT